MSYFIDSPSETVNTLNGFRRKDRFVDSVLLIGAVSGWLVNQIETRRAGLAVYILCGRPSGERVEFCVSNPDAFCVLDGDGRVAAHVPACNARKLARTLFAEVRRFRADEARCFRAVEAVHS